MSGDGANLLVREALAWGTERLARCGVPGAALDALVLLGHVLGTGTAGVHARGESEISGAAMRAFRRLVARRARREPVAYITGHREFMSLDFAVDPRVLIPRPETEVLVEEALHRLRADGRQAWVADVGTGSGAIAVSLAFYLPGCRAVASDLSPDALEVAAENARRHGVAERITLVAGEGLDPLRPWAPYRAILCNPPYVVEGEEVDPEVTYEPRAAWYAGPDPLEPYRRLVGGAAGLLEPGGFLAVEVGAGRATAVAEMFARYLVDVSVREDLAGIPRVVVAVAPGGCCAAGRGAAGERRRVRARGERARGGSGGGRRRDHRSAAG